MHPALKILIGALLIVAGVFSTILNFDKLVYVARAGIGPILALVGAFIVWLESDELKMRREESREVQQQFSEVAETEETVEDDRHECPECGKKFDTERGMHIHQAQKHE
ncbi:MAG: hypothetical protein ABEJ56_00780 [Candidatus Nanohaloarchaea archaeon]